MLCSLGWPLGSREAMVLTRLRSRLNSSRWRAAGCPDMAVSLANPGLVLYGRIELSPLRRGRMSLRHQRLALCMRHRGHLIAPANPTG